MFQKLLFIILTAFLLFFFISDVNAQTVTSDCTSSACFIGACQTLTLTPQDVQSLWDNFLYNASKPSLLKNGQNAEQSKQDFNGLKQPPTGITAVDKAGGVALTKDITPVSGVDKTSPMNNQSCNGDFLMAMILNNTMRLGRCDATTKNCSVYDSGLQYSNDEGQISTAKKSFAGLFDSSALTSDITKKDPNAPAPETFLEKPSNLGPQPQAPDLNDSELQNLTANIPYRVSGLAIQNSVKADDFSAHFLNLCTGQNASDRCKIYVYSFFDRFYNSYYSGSMVVTTFGPAIWGVGAKIAEKTGLKTVYGKFTEATGIGEGIKKLKSNVNWFKGEVLNYQTRAIGSTAKIRGMLSSKMDAKAIKEFEAAFAESGDDPLIDIFSKKVREIFDTPEKKKAFVAYVKDRAAYSNALKQELAFLEKDAGEAAKVLVAQDDAASALGHSIVDRFYEKQGKSFGYMYVDTGKTATATTAAAPLPQNVMSDPIKKKILNHEIKLESKITIGGVETDTLSFSNPAHRAEFLGRLKKVKAGDFHGNYPPDALDALANGSPNMYVAEVGTEVIPINPTTLDAIKNASPGAQIKVLKTGGTTTVSPEEAEQFLEKIQGDFVTFGGKDVGKVASRSENLLGFMSKTSFGDKKYLSFMNWALYNDKWLIGSPTAWKKFASWTVVPPAYWKMKTAEGSPLKAYFIGEKDLSNVDITTGDGSIYSDAYIDFFVNKKFFNGDFFMGAMKQYISTLATLAPEESDFISEKSANEFFGITLREDVKDVVFYTTTGDTSCESCNNSKQILKNGQLQITTLATKDSKNYILEMPDPVTFSEGGLSLAAFTHHTDIKFTLGNDTKGNELEDEINLAQAISLKETCADKTATSFWGNLPIMGDWFKNNSSRVGLATGISENVLFYTSMMFVPGIGGLIAGLGESYLLDSLTMGHFSGCVDAEEGYYINYVHGFEKTPSKQDALKSTVAEGKEKTKPLEGLNKVDEGITKIKETFVKLVESKDNEFLQIEYETLGQSQGKYDTGGLFLDWIGPRVLCSAVSNPVENSIVKAEGTTPTGEKIELVIEPGKETISVNGKTILKNPNVRLASYNGIFGGYEIPQNVTFIPADLGVDYFLLSPYGDFKILDPNTEMCVRSGIAKQTGFMNVQSIIDYTGVVQKANTLEGTELRPTGNSFMASGGSVQRINVPESIIVDANVDLVGAVNKSSNFGTLASITFQKAILLYRQNEKDFMLWVRIIASIRGTQVQNFSAMPTKVNNPNTNCEETAFDLSVKGNPLDAQALKDADAFNSALKKAGPFQYFETPDNVIMFYSKLENGQCKEYMKVVDKKTNKVITDAPIESFEKTDNGFKITTADGKTHELDFSNEGGRPTLTYNGKKADLLMAQGKNGSFYYNPETGEWFVGNSQMLPLSDSFAEDGLLNIGGVAKPGGNPLATQSSGSAKQGVFDIPIFELKERFWFIFASLAIIFSIIFITSFKRGNI